MARVSSNVATRTQFCVLKKHSKACVPIKQQQIAKSSNYSKCNNTKFDIDEK